MSYQYHIIGCQSIRKTWLLMSHVNRNAMSGYPVRYFCSALTIKKKCYANYRQIIRLLWYLLINEGETKAIAALSKEEFSLSPSCCLALNCTDLFLVCFLNKKNGSGQNHSWSKTVGDMIGKQSDRVGGGVQCESGDLDSIIWLSHCSTL